MAQYDYTAYWMPHTKMFKCPKCLGEFGVVKRDRNGMWKDFQPVSCPSCGETWKRVKVKKAL